MIDTKWLVLAGVWLIYFSFGVTIASMAPVLAEIRADIDTNNATIGLILGSWPITYILCAIPCGMLLDRVGARRMLALATLIMGASAVARGYAETPMQLFFAVALFGAGGPMISVGAPLVIARLYDGPARATAMGLYVTGPYLGGLLALAVTNSLVMPLVGGNWRAVMMVAATLVLFSGAVWLAVSGLQKERLSAGQDGKKYSLAALADILGQRQVRLILAISVGIFFINHGFNNWMPELLRAHGLTPVAAGYWAALPPAVGILGVLVIPRLATQGRRVAALGALVTAVLLASVLLHWASPGLLGSGLILQGVARGSMMTIAIMILMDTPGIPPERLGLAGGMFFTAAEVGGVLGPLTFGALSHVTGGFGAALLAVSGVCAALLATLWALHRSGASRGV